MSTVNLQCPVAILLVIRVGELFLRGAFTIILSVGISGVLLLHKIVWFEVLFKINGTSNYSKRSNRHESEGRGSI